MSVYVFIQFTNYKVSVIGFDN